MFSRHDHECMSLAIRLARKGLFSTDPNPRVGCVISRDDKVIASGWHQQAGGAHAEVYAIDNAGTSLVGATAYVTLEPCSHHGRTPPCCEALAACGIARVVVAMQDPNPQVSGAGIDYLRQQGIRVDYGLNEREAHALNPGFASRMVRNRPWVRVKLASSLDGGSALQNGVSQWITGAAARRDGHRWRARSSCILTGSGTVKADNPSLTVRLEDETVSAVCSTRQPLRAIIDSQLVTDPQAKLFSLPGKILIFTNHSSDKFSHLPDVSVVVCKQTAAGKIDLHAIMHYLASIEINEVHVEAGAGLCGALLQENLIDELLIYQAASVLGASARSLFDLPVFDQMHQQIPLRYHDVRRFGEDLRLILRPAFR